MQPAQHVAAGIRVVVLDEAVLNACGCHRLLVEAFQKKSARISKYFRLEQQNVRNSRPGNLQATCLSGRNIGGSHQNTLSLSICVRYAPYLFFFIGSAIAATCAAVMYP